MIGNDTNKDWEKFGKENPYYGVISDESLKTRNLNPEALERFFASGRQDIDRVFRAIAKVAGPGFQPRSALDFGCGVGRLAIPLAERCESVVGVDVSPSMLKEARANCERMQINNLAFCGSIAEARGVAGFDFINSYIVFQHIPVARGYALFGELVDLLSPGGVGALHLTFAISASSWQRITRWLRRRFQPFNVLINLAKGKAPGDPFMQMNGYDLNRVMLMIKSRGCCEIHLSLTDHGGHVGTTLFFRKPIGRLV
jgi:SAM-dependent methyltransferase